MRGFSLAGKETQGGATAAVAASVGPHPGAGARPSLQRASERRHAWVTRVALQVRWGILQVRDVTRLGATSDCRLQPLPARQVKGQ